MPHRRPTLQSSDISHQHPEISGLRTANTVVVGTFNLLSHLEFLLYISCFHIFSTCGELTSEHTGNGPAALCLSYLLHGNIPFYDPVTHGPHPDPVLHKKLAKTVGKPLFCALDSPNSCERLTDHFPASNLSYSTQALPLNTLLDTLQRPNADTQLGEVKSRIRWEKWPQKSVDHMVLGSAPDAGGQWTEDPVSTNWDIGTLRWASSSVLIYGIICADMAW